MVTPISLWTAWDPISANNKLMEKSTDLTIFSTHWYSAQNIWVQDGESFRRHADSPTVFLTNYEWLMRKTESGETRISACIQVHTAPAWKGLGTRHHVGMCYFFLPCMCGMHVCGPMWACGGQSWQQEFSQLSSLYLLRQVSTWAWTTLIELF